MKDINIFCFGFGQVAKNFIEKLKKENYNIKLSATSRDKSTSSEISGIKFQKYQFSENNIDPSLNKNLKKADHVLISIPPINGEDIVVKNFSDTFNEIRPKWVTYLSATSVYGDHKGEWVNEDSETLPTSKNGIDRLKAENSWASLQKNKNLSIQIFRLSGIYSAQNNILVRLKSGNAYIISKKNNFFSRIHVEDIGNILLKSLGIFKSGEIYNISDDKPCSSEEVTIYGAKILNLSLPKKIDIIDIESEMLKNFYKDSKKVSNKKMKYFFNYNLKFPTYIEGLDNIRNNII